MYRKPNKEKIHIPAYSAKFGFYYEIQKDRIYLRYFGDRKPQQPKIKILA